jgi:hypothetical protein
MITCKSMPSFDIIDKRACCMRKNYTREQYVKENVEYCMILCSVYVAAAIGHNIRLCLLAMIMFYVTFINMLVTLEYDTYTLENNIPLPDSSVLSQRQIEHGATNPRGMTADEEALVYQQLREFKTRIEILNETNEYLYKLKFYKSTEFY